MKPDNFRFLTQFLKNESGLFIAEDKAYLVDSRLAPVARKRGHADLDDLIVAVRDGKEPTLGTDVIEAMTTNESFFFRDIRPFESLKNTILPRIVRTRKATGAKKIRIWSAACSSGQEPYSIAMILKENPDILQGLGAEVVGTDISGAILEKAREGIYTQFEAQRGLPIQLLIKYFTQVGEHWQINEEIRAAVRLEQANLLQDPSRLGRFDAIFCRNVLIYFDETTKAAVLRRIESMMPADGYLFLGAAETVVGISDSFRKIEGERGVYVKTTQPVAKSA